MNETIVSIVTAFTNKDFMIISISTKYRTNGRLANNSMLVWSSVQESSWWSAVRILQGEDESGRIHLWLI